VSGIVKAQQKGDMSKYFLENVKLCFVVLVERSAQAN